MLIKAARVRDGTDSSLIRHVLTEIFAASTLKFVPHTSVLDIRTRRIHDSFDLSSTSSCRNFIVDAVDRVSITGFSILKLCLDGTWGASSRARPLIKVILFIELNQVEKDYTIVKFKANQVRASQYRPSHRVTPIMLNRPMRRGQTRSHLVRVRYT
uniref:Uncharacterized protein n=1 Tax=Hyaloperonospora arabidopsidis (strain Emoy2) TaxID=559515 RepID=M4BK02_HYAAE